MEYITIITSSILCLVLFFNLFLAIRNIRYILQINLLVFIVIGSFINSILYIVIDNNIMLSMVWIFIAGINFLNILLKTNKL